MTAVGKILVFLNLVFSLVVSAFIIFIYVARTHWEDATKQLTAENSVLRASETTYKNEVLKAQKDADDKVGKKDAELASVQKDLVSAKRENGQLRDDLAKLRTKGEQQLALGSKSGAEVEKRQEDVGKLRDALHNSEQKNNALVQRNTELIHDATVAKIDRDSYKDRNNRLVAQLEQMAKDLTKLRAGGGASSIVRADRENPPLDNVDGLVKNVDGNLMTITIGSDAGLVKGNTLKLFRLSPAKYLGTVRILELEATQAVVQPMGRLLAKPQAGDRVASRISSGG